jgi:hypothetical protein
MLKTENPQFWKIRMSEIRDSEAFNDMITAYGQRKIMFSILELEKGSCGRIWLIVFKKILNKSH